MSSAEELRIYLNELAQALQRNLPPAPIPPDLPAGAESEIDMLVAALGAAATAGDPDDMASAEAGFAERALKTGEAMARFPENEAQSAQAMQQVLGMAQQLPQQMSGLGQGANGAFGGIFQQLNQMLQQGLQAGQRMAGVMGDTGGLSSGTTGALSSAAGSGGSLGGLGGAGAGIGSTVPSGNLGATGSPGEPTRPATLRQTPVAAEGGTLRGGAMGGGYPMMGPGAAGAAGAGAAGGKDAGTDTKRVMPQAIKNGAPVQGRIVATPKLPEVTKHVDAKPVVARRVPSLEPKPDEK